MLTIVAWKWGNRYSARHVAILQAMLKRHLHVPHHLIVVTDNPRGLPKDIEVVPLWREYDSLRRCWKRLKAFSRQAQKWFGRRHLSIDLDVVITGDITPLVNRPEDLVLCKAGARHLYPHNPYSGTMWLQTTGCRHRVFDEFDRAVRSGRLKTIHQQLKQQGFNGSDSAWLGHILGPDEAVWTREEGIVSFPWDIQLPKEQGTGDGSLPADARIVLFHGKDNDPADPKLQAEYPWIAEHWSLGEQSKPTAVRPEKARLTVVTWKWGTRYTARHVNTLYSMLKRHLHVPFEMVCVTDNPQGINKPVRIVKLWHQLRDLGGCYCRLKAFRPEMEREFGRRFVSIDLDCVITGDVTPLLTRSEDFVICRDGLWPATPYNGSMWLMTAGARSQVWDTFTRRESPAKAKKLGYVGTDQAWIAACLGPDEAQWTTDDGVYSYRHHVLKNGGELPEDARIVFFHGRYDPSQADVQRHEWVRENWR